MPESPVHTILNQRFPMSVFKILNSLIVFTCIAAAGDSLQIRSVKFAGNNSFTGKELTEIITELTKSANSVSSPADDSAAVMDFYINRGFLNAAIDTMYVKTDTSGKYRDLYIGISEGRRELIRRINLTGCSGIAPEELHAVMKLKEGSVFVPRLLEEDIGGILGVYDTKGYPLAKVTVGNISFSDSIKDSYATIELIIEEGKRLHITEIRVVGNTTTNESVIIREARLKKDQLFYADLPETVKRRLDRLQLFSSVSMPELYLTERGEGGLYIGVKEGKHNSFDGVLGYIPPDASGREGYLTGLVDISFRNLFGTGRKLAVRWFQENRVSRETELHYCEPWIASLPVNVQLGFKQRKQDSTFVREQYDISADFMITEEFSAGISFSQTIVYPSEGYGQRAVPPSRTTGFGVSVRYDSRDDPVTPEHGLLYSTEYRSGSKRTGKNAFFPEGSDNSTRLLLFDLLYYLSPFHRQVVAAEMHVRDFSSASIDPSDLFHLGGATTLRGYSEGQFLGSRLAWLNLEYRFIVAARSFFYGFIDFGYIENPDFSTTTRVITKQNKIGYGIGIRMDSGIGLIGVSFAFGEGDTFGTSKIHLRLINEF
jgi:outer membrane protein insertion porin family